MEKRNAGPIHLIWDPRAKLLQVEIEPASALVAAHAHAMADALMEWVGDQAVPFGTLADLSGLATTDAEFRAVMGAFYQRHRAHGFIALLNVSAGTRILVEMFRIGTGAHLRIFPDKAAALAWLRGLGISG
jgi:hypothetical protein